MWKRLPLAPFNFTKEVTNIVAELCAVRLPVNGEKGKYPYCLPQWTPTSPLLANAICYTLNRRLAWVAKRFGLRYSLYSDDIAFSSMHNIYQTESAFRRELERVVAGQSFHINAKQPLGLFTRTAAKTASLTELQYLNFVNHRKIGQVKYALILIHPTGLLSLS